MERKDDRKVLRYSVAALICLAAVAVSYSLTPLIGWRSPFITYYPAVVFATLLCGLGPGVAATMVCMVLANAALIIFADRAVYTPFVLVVQTLPFLAVGLLTAWMASGRFPIRSFIDGPMGNHETRAQRSEQALEEQKVLFGIAERFSGVGVWEWDFKSNDVFWSDGLYDLLRVRRGEGAPEDIWTRCVDTKDLEESAKRIMRAISERKREHYFELGVTRGDGTRGYLATRGEIEYDDAGNALRINGVNFDITERRNSEQKISVLNGELSKKVQELQAIFDIAPVGIAVALDSTCEVIVPNIALAQFAGVGPDTNLSPNPETTGRKSLRYFRRGKELANWELPLQRSIAEKRPVFDEQIDVVREDGTQVSLLWSAAPIFDENGKVVSAVSAQVDITDQQSHIRALETDMESEKSMRQEAEILSRVKDEFLAMVSHELRTPLNAILGWASLLTADNVAEDVKQKGLNAIEISARAQSVMIDDLIDLSKIIAGKLRIGRYFLDLIPLVTSAVDIIRPAALGKGVGLGVSIDPSVGKISGDAERVQQIVWNLMSNAVKFTPGGGRVDLSLSVDGQFAKLTVKDTGCGIKPDFLPFVFERFRQQDGSLTRKYDGLGLGLAITKSLVELHGGTIDVESPGPDRGSTFTIRIPLVPEAIVGATSGRLPKFGKDTGKLVGNELNGALVLVVDDDPDSREVVKIFLEQYGCVVVTASSAADAFEKFSTNGFRIIVSDIGMPDEDGYQMMKRIRAFEGDSSRVPAVALTAYARSEDRAASVEAGFDEHIAKPVEPDLLVATAARLLRVR